MRIAIPLSGVQLSRHFGRSEHFLFGDADMEQREVLSKTVETTPDHAPGLLPARLAEHRADIVIAAGLGSRARDLLAADSLQVLTDVSGVGPDVLVSDLVDGGLETGMNAYNHSLHGCRH